MFDILCSILTDFVAGTFPWNFSPDFVLRRNYAGVVRLATTPEEQRRWMEQWREAAIALDEVRRDELMNLSDEEAWRHTEDLLALADHYLETSDTSGLVEQQYWFQAGHGP